MSSKGVSPHPLSDRLAHSQAIGNKAEFVIAPEFLAHMGWEYRQSSAEENRIHHFDYIVSRGNVEYKVEVKAPKTCKHPTHSLLRPVLLEYTGITGHPGWLRGKADVILQVTSDDSLIAYHRLDALHAYKPPCEAVERYYSSNPPIQKWFGRQGFSKAGRPNQDIIRWEPHNAFIRETKAVTYRKIDGIWRRPI
ncbi:MAG: hypothetical protein ACO3HP_03820 [Candidatus Nanopelagicaceae bacterium]